MHALNRLGYGPRPGDVERVTAMGIEKYVEQQLNPSTVDNTDMEARLKHYTTLARSSGDLMKDYPQANQAAKKLGMTPEEYRAAMEAQRAQKQAQMRQAVINNP